MNDIEICWIAANRLTVRWPNAQRPPRNGKIKEISGANFDFDKLGTATVSAKLEDGMYHIIDGQTRIAAMRETFGDDFEVPCSVTKADGEAACAAIFRGINGGRTKPSAMEMFLTGVAAGDAKSCGTLRAVEAAGLRIAPNAASGVVRAVGALTALYDPADDGEKLTRALRTIRMAWGDQPAAYDRTIILGVASYLAEIAADEKAAGAVANKIKKKFSVEEFISYVRQVMRSTDRKGSDAAAFVLADICRSRA